MTLGAGSVATSVGKGRHVVIIGAGVVGLSSAYYARRRGFEVTVVDREGPLRATTSFGNAGFIVPSHFVPLAAPGAVAQGIRWMFDPESPFYVRPSFDPALLSWGYRFWRSSKAGHVRRSAPLLRDLNRAGYARYRELAERFGDVFDLHQRGLLMLCSSERGLEHEAATAHDARALGLPVELLEPSEVQALEPGVDLAVVGATYYPEDAALDPGRFMTALQADLAKGGVRFLWHAEATGLELRGRHVTGVRVSRARWSAGAGTHAIGPTLPKTLGSGGREPADPAGPPDVLELDALVLAAGVWSGDLTRQLGFPLPMQAGKGYSLTLTTPVQPLRTPAILSEAHVAVTPLEGALRFGGTMEVTHAPAANRPDDTGRASAGAVRRSGAAAQAELSRGAKRRVHGIVSAVGRYLPAYPVSAFAGVPVWYGFRPTSPDGLPFLGNAPGHDNVVVATGHAMLGMSLGPVTGSLVGELLADEPTSIPIAALRPDRFKR